MAAYEELVRTHEQAAFRAAFLVLNDAGDAADVAQEAFIKAYHALGTFKRGRPFRPWLARIVTNQARNTMRSTRRREGLAERYIKSMPPSGTAQSPEAALLADERRSLILEAISKLGGKDQTVLHLRHFLEFSDGEIAEVMGYRPGTVRSRVHRASRRLKKIVDEQYPDLVISGAGRGEG